MQEFRKLLTGIWEKRLAGLGLLSGTGLPLWYIAKNPATKPYETLEDAALTVGSVFVGYGLGKALGIFVDNISRGHD